MRFLFLFLFLSFSVLLYSQKPPPKFKSYKCPQILQAGDIKNALNAGAVKKITLQCSPVGSGETIEVASGNKKDKFYFEKEHNVVWVKFTSEAKGLLSFRIKPLSENDDYDFLLFKVKDENTINQIVAKKLKPLRSNLARNKKENNGVTGLKLTSSEKHTISGVQNEFSKPIMTRQGDEYYLALDNVYNEGKGAMIYFDYSKTKKIRGTVKNDANEKILDAEVTWDDEKTGETLAKTRTDKVTGEYEMIIPYDSSDPSKKYVFSVSAERHFFQERIITASEISSDSFKPINLVLPKLKKVKGINCTI
jgi:hypothetical protein